MAYLTRPQKYDIEDSNIALLGSDVRIACRTEGLCIDSEFV